MIENLALRNFKRFKALSLAFRPLTVLTGLNGAGKSTAVQSLLLARQAADDPGTRVVQLNGPYGLALGEALDVLNSQAEQPVIEVVITDSGSDFRYEFAVSEDRSLHLDSVSAPDGSPPSFSESGLHFSYLCAERLGPRDQLEVTAEAPDRAGIGVRGEFTGQVLAVRETNEVRPALRHSDTGLTNVITLRTQVELWIADVLRPVRISAQWPAGLTASLIRYQEPGVLGEPIRPANMGFGFSYVLPIIVAGLLLPSGGLLVVENPEAHLHPAAQSRLGRFLATVAGSGAQVIVETHSDHLVNGIRLAVAEDQALSGEDGVIHFFGEEADGPLEIGMTDRGGLSAWPKGFFDQIESDLGRLTRAKRTRR